MSFALKKMYLKGFSIKECGRGWENNEMKMRRVHCCDQNTREFRIAKRSTSGRRELLALLECCSQNIPKSSDSSVHADEEVFFIGFCKMSRRYERTFILLKFRIGWWNLFTFRFISNSTMIKNNRSVFYPNSFKRKLDIAPAMTAMSATAKSIFRSWIRFIVPRSDTPNSMLFKSSLPFTLG